VAMPSRMILILLFDALLKTLQLLYKTFFKEMHILRDI